MNEFSAVITADIVNSSKLNEEELAILATELIGVLKAGKAKNHFYRGDSFHALCRPKHAFVLALKLRAIARVFKPVNENEQIDIRIAIGLGDVEMPVKNLATAKGEAFILSGRELDVISKSAKRLSIRIADEKLNPGMEAISLIADNIMQKMSSKQAEVILELLNGATEIEIAGKLGKSQSTVNKLKQAAGWNELEQAIKIFSSMLATIHTTI